MSSEPLVNSGGLRSPSLATLCLHGDKAINASNDVAPAMHLSTTFRYPAKLEDFNAAEFEKQAREPTDPIPNCAHIYSRITAPDTARLELALDQIIGQPTLTYASGLAALHALITWINPKVVAIGAGYHGSHRVLEVFRKVSGCKLVELFDKASWDHAALGLGDMLLLETPSNPTGTAYDIAHYAEEAHRRGAFLVVDATLAPPPLQDPFKHGADYVIHSGTKYIGGHSDMLCGIVAISRQMKAWSTSYWGLFEERPLLGAVMGSMEGWLGVRSLRTLELRVKRQSYNAERLTHFISECLNTKEPDDSSILVRRVVQRVEHASLQTGEMSWLKQQMPNGFGAVFALVMKDEVLAQSLPSNLHIFQHATSLGGVESLIEWRKLSDPTVDPRLERLSIGVESWEDLKQDLLQAFRVIASDGKDS